MLSSRFVERQRVRARHADAAHFTWKTTGSYVAGVEGRLLAGVSAAPGQRLLEIGCGEGGNLHHLRARGAVLFGVDFSRDKVAFAARATSAHVAVADATRLPFGDETFHAVLIRDLLHHLPDPARALAEAHRVLRPGGRLTLIEPNAWAPLVLLQAAVEPSERGLLRSTDRRLRADLDAAGFRLDAFDALQPLALERLTSPRLGTARLAALGWVRSALAAVDDAAARLLPRSAWTYLQYQATRP